MNAKHLLATLALTLAAGATFAAFKHAPVEAPRPAMAAECADPVPAVNSVPRVVVTAKRDPSAEAPVARVVVTAKRLAAGPTIAASGH